MAASKQSPRAPRRKAKARSSTAEFEKLIRGDTPRRHYLLRLYVTGSTARSARAIANIRALCEELLSGRYELAVVDLYQKPSEAAGEQIIAAPTLIKKSPAPMRRVIGDLSDREKVLMELDLRSEETLATGTAEE